MIALAMDLDVPGLPKVIVRDDPSPTPVFDTIAGLGYDFLSI
jgi:hypothetical protein